MAQSTFSRLWKAVKPPQAAKRTGAASSVLNQKVVNRKALNRKQKRLLLATCGGIVAIGAGWSVYDFVASAPERAAKQLQTGMKLMDPGHYQDAIVHFNRAIGIWPEFAEAYFQRGVAYQNLSQADRALADLDRAVEVDPALAHAYNAQGAIYRSRGDFERAMQAFAKAIEIAPDADAYFQRGQTYESLGEHRKAVEDFDQAIAVRRDAPYVYRARALARRNAGDLAGSEADRQIAENIEQDH
jgi:tetratricopeptide (TPR) repeat protein